MANWKKVIVSGSAAQLNQLSVDTDVNISGSLNASGSVFLPALSNQSEPNIVSIDITTGQLYYQGTGSFTADSASYADTASYVNPLNQAVIVTGSVTVTDYVSTPTVIGTGSLFLQPDPNDARNFRIYNTAPTDTHIKASGGLSYFGDDINYLKIDDSAQTATLSGVNGVYITGSLLNVTGNTFITGALSTTGAVSFAGLTSQSSSYLVGYDPATGNLYYEGTGSVVSVTSSYAVSASQAVNADTASYVNTLNQAVVISGSLAINTSTGNSFDINADTFIFTGSLNTTGSVSFAGLTQASSSYLIGYDPTTGNLSYEGTGSVVSVTSSYAISASYAIEAGKVTNALTQGTGIDTFTYDGSATATVAVSGAAGLTSDYVTKWDGSAFQNSSITDNAGTGVVINNAYGVLIQQGGLYVTGASTFHDAVVFQGDITVQGTASFQNSQNLAIADQFILLNSGSTTFQDSGFIINTGNTANSGSAWFLETAATTTGTDAANGRFAVGSQVQPDATTVTADEYAVTAKLQGGNPNTSGSVPQWGGTLNGQGNMWVDTDNGDIYIYA